MTFNPHPKRNPRNAGRKPLDNQPRRDRTVRLTQTQWEKLRELGGSAWIRSQIDNALIKTETKTPDPLPTQETAF